MTQEIELMHRMLICNAIKIGLANKKKNHTHTITSIDKYFILEIKKCICKDLISQSLMCKSYYGLIAENEDISIRPDIEVLNSSAVVLPYFIGWKVCFSRIPAQKILETFVNV